MSNTGTFDIVEIVPGPGPGPGPRPGPVPEVGPGPGPGPGVIYQGSTTLETTPRVVTGRQIQYTTLDL